MMIALIDDGIDRAACPELKVEHDLVIDTDGTVHCRGEQEKVITNHGSTCAKIIHSYAPEATFCSLAIFCGEELRANINQLIAALKWCKEKRTPLIHMSVGSARLTDYVQLQRLISQLLRRGQTVVAASSNSQDRYTMPACFQGVFGVAADPELIGSKFRVAAAKPGGVCLLASSRHMLQGEEGVWEETQIANSYAAPTITAHLHELIVQVPQERLTFPVLWRRLTGNMPPLAMRPDFMDKAIIYDPAMMLKSSTGLSFETVGHYSSLVEFFKAIEAEPNMPALVMPPFPAELDAFWTKLFQRSRHRVGIACAGSLPVSVRNSAPCLFWDEGVLKELAKKAVEGPLEGLAPVLRIEGQSEAAFQMLIRLKSFFCENGFECLAVSHYPMSYLYGVEPIPDGDEWVQHLCGISRPELILCDFPVPIPNIGESATMTLVDGAHFAAMDNRAVFPDNPSDEDMQALLAWLT